MTSTGGFAVDMAARHASTGEWSPMLEVNAWGSTEGRKKLPKKHEWCRINVDQFESSGPCDAFQLAIRYWPGGAPEVSQLIVCTRDDSVAAQKDTQFAACHVDVPFRSQQTEDPAIASRICSPTSVSMVLEHFGVHQPIADIARVLHDPDEKIYGNWARAVQGAFEMGLAGHLESFEDLHSAEQLLHDDQPLIISIRSEEGDIVNAPYGQTSGHLLVLTGIDRNGDFRVNDPAAATAKQGVATYTREAIYKTWIVNGGVAYVLYPRL